MDALARLESAGLRYYFASFSALDRYFGHPRGDNLYVAVDGTLIDLARSLGELEYPGLEDWDAAGPGGAAGLVYYRCLQDEHPRRRMSFELLDFLYDPAADTFFDPDDAYPQLRSKAMPSERPGAHPLDIVLDAAVLSARYGYEIDAAQLPEPPRPELVSEATERRLIVDLLGARDPARGLQLLYDTGFVSAVWPELARMNTTSHSKEHHPEGNVWEHSLETLRYRKTPDLLLSLGLLFHDSGKPLATRTRDRVFDGHAEIGADIARRFLERVGFSRDFAGDVAWLVNSHMFPGALHTLPAHRTDKLMRSRLFPILLELYRCDLSSTFRGPDGYYRACRIYRSFLKNVSNPFRDAAGKKLVKLYVD
jgi:poly(A) polymerase